MNDLLKVNEKRLRKKKKQNEDERYLNSRRNVRDHFHDSSRAYLARGNYR